MSRRAVNRTLRLALVLAAAILSAQKKAKIAILATGGTIAGAGDASGYGYKAGAFKVQDLLKAVPKIGDLAQLSGEHRQPGHERQRLANAGGAH